MKKAECELCGEEILILRADSGAFGGERTKHLATEAVDPLPHPAVAEIADDKYGRVVVHQLHRRTCVHGRRPEVKALDPLRVEGLD